MSDLFDFDDQPDQYAVMGNPIAHSKSPRIHAAFARQTGQNIEYRAIHVDLGGFPQAVGNFVASGGKGLNITVPFKQEAFALVQTRSPRAERAGAVNTIKIEKQQLFGDTTDGIGLVTDLLHNHQVTLRDMRILLMGAGGAARGVIEPLLRQNPTYLLIANRTPDKAVELATLFADLGTVHGSGYEQLTEQQFDVVINATSASLQGDMPELPDEILAENGCCYDMMYGKVTQFMTWAQYHGAGKILDGLGMLVEQAAESFAIWRGVRPDTAPVIKQLRSELETPAD